MEPADHTLEVLKGIQTELRAVREQIHIEVSGVRDELHTDLRSVRDELHADIRSVRDELHADLRGVRDEVRETNVRVDRLERRQIESEMRIATEIVAVAGAVRELRDPFKDDLAVRHEVRDLQHRVGALETRE